MYYKIGDLNSHAPLIHHICTQFKETLDTVANLDEELREKVHRLSVGGTPAPPDTAVSNSVCNGSTMSNGPLNSSMPNDHELSISVPPVSKLNCPPGSNCNGPTDPLSSNTNTKS